MQKVMTIALHEYWVNVRRPDFIIVTLLVPALGIIGLLVSVFFGRQAGGAVVRLFDDGPQRAALVDQSGRFTPILPQFLEEFIPYSDEAVARSALDNETVRRVIVIPSTYPESGDVTVVSADRQVFGFGDERVALILYGASRSGDRR